MKSLARIVLCLCLLGPASYAQTVGQPVPHILNVQGVLRNAGGEVVTGTYSAIFTLWDAQTGGTKLWDSGTQSISVTGGVFNTYLDLGSTDPFKNRSAVWLQIQFGTDVLPRRPIASVGYAYQSEHAEVADEASNAYALTCTGCIGDTQLGVNYAASTSKGGPATGLSCTGCVGSTQLADGGVTSTDIADGTIATVDIANNAVTTTKIADGNITTAKIADSAVTTAKIADGAVTSAKIAAGAVGDSQLGVNYAGSNSKGGPALDLSCTGCVESAEVNFNWALGVSKGGDAAGLQCSTPCVSSSEVDFNYAGSSSKGGPATALSCNDCITASMVQFNYAGSTSEGGPATSLACTGCVTSDMVNFSYAAGTTKGGAATDVQCSGCVGDSDLATYYAYGDSSHRAINLECSGCVGSGDIASGAVTDTHVASGISGWKITAATASSRGTVAPGVGLYMSGDTINVQFAGSGSANTAARSDHTHSEYLGQGGPYYLNEGNKFYFKDSDNPSDDIYMWDGGAGAANNVSIQFRLSQSGSADTSRKVEVYTASSNINTVTHAFYANGNAYHYGSLQLGGSLTCTGCVSSTNVADGSLTGTDIADNSISGSKIQTNTSINLGTGTLTAGDIYASRFIDKDNTSYLVDPNGSSQVSTIYANNWFRAQGQTGFLFSDYGGGWYMTDGTWIRAYGSKSVWTPGTMQADSNMYSPIYYDLNDGGYYADPNGTSQFSKVRADNWFEAQGNTGIQFTSYGGGWYMSDSTWIRAYNDKAVYSGGEIRSGSNVRAPIFYDLEDGNYYINPNGASQVSTIYANNWFRAQGQSGFYFQDYGGGWYMTDSTWIRAYNGKNIYTPGGIQADAWIQAPIWYDTNLGGCQLDLSGESRGWRIGAQDVIGWSSVRGTYAVFSQAYVSNGLLVSSPNGDYLQPSIVSSGSVIPSSNATYDLGWGNRYDWGGHGKSQWNAWWGITGYNIWTVSSEREKKDIKDLSDEDLELVLQKVRQARSVYYWFNQEYKTIEESRAQAIVKVEELAQKRGTMSEEEKAKNLEVMEQKFYRPIPHLGVIAESLPSELHPGGRTPYMYSLADMDGFLLAAIKALDKKLQDRDERLSELEDRVAFLEQLLVDQGILK